LLTFWQQLDLFMKYLSIFILLALSCSMLDAQAFNKITTYQKVLNVYGGSFVGDINGDGYDDIVCVDKRYIYLMLNNGTDSIGFTKILLDQELSDKKVFKLWDVDGDGDLDILMGATSKIVLIENQSTPGNPRFAKGKDFLYFGNNTKNLVNFDIGDLNGDALYDIVVAYGRTEVFFQREDKPYFRFEIGNAVFNDVQQVQIADLNNDKRMDILLCGKDTTNHKGLLFLHNTVNNFSSGVLLNTNPTSSFFLTKMDENNPVSISALVTNSEEASIINYNHVSTGDTLTFKEHDRLFLSKQTPIIAMGEFNQNITKDLLLGYDKPSPIKIRYDYIHDSTATTVDLDSVGSVKAVYISDLNKDEADDIIVFTDKNAFLIYEQIVKPVSAIETRFEIKLSPNPTSDYLQIEMDVPATKFFVYDMTGHIAVVFDSPSVKSAWLDVRQLKAGIYTIVPVLDNKLLARKLFYKL
jgi:hypothetical protein